MKLSQLRPCDHCGGSLPPTWYVVRLSQCMLDQKATNETLGLAQMLGSVKLAEVMGSRPEEAVIVLGDRLPSMWTELFLCQDCTLGMSDGEPIDLGELMQKVMDRKEDEST